MKRLLYIFTILFAFTACSDQEWLDTGDALVGDFIKVGGITTSSLDISVSDNATRSAQIKDAETVDWLIKPLKQGLDITYGKVDNVPEKRRERVAILKLTGGTLDDNVYDKDPVTQWAIYTFQYKGTDPAEDAIWYDNGEHYFEGMFVPDNLRYGPEAGTDRGTLSSVNTTSAPNITTDQNNPDNYSYLEHYLAMPANTQIHATVGRVKLPFYHRLSRVIAYILIDPEMQADPAHPDVTLKGYKLSTDGTYTYEEYKKLEGNGDVTQEQFNALPATAKIKENPATTSLRFCNVEVLNGVYDTKNAQDYHVLTPQWGQTQGVPKAIRKVIPHFEAEEGSMVQNALGNFEQKDPDFYMFYDDNTQEYIFPTMDKWINYYNDYKDAADEVLEAAKVTRTKYGKVPVYDLIVRPTYDAENKVMYDEHNASDQELNSTEKAALVEKKNKIDFELTLSNGLIYTKEFEFDLNANEQTVVYLRISRESVDYNASGSDIWVIKNNNDDWYGVDNRGGHSLSDAGCTWQRAYTYGTTVSDDKVTDGGFYNENTTGEDGTVGQYVTAETWIKKFAQAYQGGECHGDYFILRDNIEIDAKSLPDNFIFTGHLDAHGHKITLTGTNTDWVEYVATTDYSVSPIYSDQSGTVYTLPTLYTKEHHDANYNSDSELYQIGGKWYLISSLTFVPEISHKATQDDVDEGKAANIGDNVVDTPAHYETNSGSIEKQEAYDTYNVATPTLAEAMGDETGIYFVKESTEYVPFKDRKPTTLYKKVDHKSGSALFAGLNGAYETTTEGEANVHTENNNVKVPYKDDDSGTGWRAEVMNLEVVGNLFANDVYSPDAATRTGYHVTKVSGNVQNCKDSQGKVPNHTPALFKY